MNSKMRMKDLWSKRHTWEVGSIYGTLIFLGLTVYFFLMYAVGLVHVTELRFLNVIIMLAGVYYAVKQYRRTHDGVISYFRTLAVGTFAGAIGASTFALFIFLFLQFEGNLMESIRQNEAVGRYLNPYIASFAVLLEGIISGFGLSYLLGNYMITEKTNVPAGGMIPLADGDGHYHSETEHS
jgi:hypothetical protein